MRLDLLVTYKSFRGHIRSGWRHNLHKNKREKKRQNLSKDINRSAQTLSTSRRINPLGN